ncbi:MAG: FAD binding domain-containing protein [Anaerolineae bacterium]
MANPTTYYRPKTLAEALKLAEQPGAIPLAGGGMALGSLEPPYQTIIDVQDVPEMRRVEHHANGATFGAAVSLETVLEWSGLPAAFQRALTRAIPLNLRDNISIGESLRLWQTPMLREWITTLLAHDAGIEAIGADGEPAWGNMIELLAGDQLEQTFITALNLPALRQGHTLGAAYVARTPADAPIVNAAAFIYVDGRRVESEFVFVGGASEPPIMQVSLETLVGNPLDEANIASAVKAVAPQVDPVGDYLGSAEYRREMARVVVQRALLECMGQIP